MRIQTQTGQWLPGQGGLKVMPLHSFATQHTALVKWPAGCWLRSPHMSQHTPFVEQETIILVRTGHLPLADYSAKVTAMRLLE